jgi:hypothetical protein
MELVKPAFNIDFRGNELSLLALNVLLPFAVRYGHCRSVIVPAPHKPTAELAQSQRMD